MQISQLEHFLMMANDIEETASWYVDNLGFRVGKNPDFGVPLAWLYLGDKDVIHISQSSGKNRLKRPAAARSEIVKGGYPIHHIAFRAYGLDDMLVQLESINIEFVEQRAVARMSIRSSCRGPTASLWN